jgi:F0F1-type ATP synthase assembly protein I
MPWSYKAKRDALFIMAVVVPALMIGLGLGGYFISRAIGLASDAGWIAIFLTTVGLVASIFVTLKIGEKYETPAEKSGASST